MRRVPLLERWGFDSGAQFALVALLVLAALCWVTVVVVTG